MRLYPANKASPAYPASTCRRALTRCGPRALCLLRAEIRPDGRPLRRYPVAIRFAREIPLLLLAIERRRHRPHPVLDGLPGCPGADARLRGIPFRHRAFAAEHNSFLPSPDGLLGNRDRRRARYQSIVWITIRWRGRDNKGCRDRWDARRARSADSPPLRRIVRPGSGQFPRRIYLSLAAGVESHRRRNLLPEAHSRVTGGPSATPDLVREHPSAEQPQRRSRASPCRLDRG